MSWLVFLIFPNIPACRLFQPKDSGYSSFMALLTSYRWKTALKPIPRIWGFSYLSVLFNQFGEVVEETMLGPQEIKLVVPLLFLHQLGEELPAIPSHELGCQFDHVQVKGRDRGRVCDELKVGRRLLRNHRLLDHLGLDLRKEQEATGAVLGHQHLS